MVMVRVQARCHCRVSVRRLVRSMERGGLWLKLRSDSDVRASTRLCFRFMVKGG